MITQHIIIGAAPLVACSKDTPDVDDIVNRFSPNGGVIRPQIITIHINTPRWSSLSPNSTPIGTRIGARISSAGAVSISAPAIRNIMITTAR